MKPTKVKELRMLDQILDEPLVISSPPLLREYQEYETEALNGERAAINGGRIIRDWSVEDRNKHCLIKTNQQNVWINASYYVDEFSSIDSLTFNVNRTKGENPTLDSFHQLI